MLKDAPAQPPGPGPSSATEDATDHRAAIFGPDLLCARCNERITREDERTTVGGAHEHTRLNPGGYLFRFGCFAHADGCVVSGEPTTEDAWFPGVRWQYAHCQGCSFHLGWFFSGQGTASGEGAAFFGLVLERLVRSR